MTETPEERARRLGLVSGGETPDARAARLGLTSQTTQRTAPRESLRLDVRQPSESTAALPSNRVDRDSNFAGLPSDAGATVAGLAATAGQAVPGMERVQALVRAGVRRQPYREALSDMRAVTDPIPGSIKFAAQLPVMAGGASALGKIPGRIGALMQSPAKAGAVIGAADQALSADEMSPIARGVRTASAGLLGSIIGKGADIGITGVRALKAASPDANAMARKAATKAESKINYGVAKAEGRAAGGTSPEIQTALARPDVAPFVARARSSQKYAKADDTDVLRAVRKRMGKQQRGLDRRVREQGYDDALQTQSEDLGNARGDLLTAADKTMPALRKADAAHAKSTAEREAVETGSSAAARVVGAPAKGKNLTTESVAAYEEKFAQMTPEQKKAAIEGVLGGLKERTGITGNAISGFGAATSPLRAAKVGSFLRRVGDPTQRKLDTIVRSGLLGATSLEELLGH